MQVNSNLVLSRTRKKCLLRFLVDVFVVVVMGILLFMGSSAQIFRARSDSARYQCYALAFLNNVKFATSRLPAQCGSFFGPGSQSHISKQTVADLRASGVPEFLIDFEVSQDLSQPFHALPHEYPLLALVPFLLVAFVPLPWYQTAFGVLMIVLAAVTYALLARYRSQRAAIIGAVLLIIGGWGTVAGRFDIVPSLFTFVAVILAERRRWTWAFVMLALAFLMKFYPIILLIPFLLGQQMDVDEKRHRWRRWRPLLVFSGLCVLVMGVSFLLSVEGTIAPLSYFQARPIQVESFGSSVIWLSNFVQFQPMTFEFTYGSLNVVHPYTLFVSSGESVLEVAGLFYVAWLQWRHRLALAQATLLTLLVVMVTGKVFSPQYLIWVLPLVAYVGGTSLPWIVSWIIIAGLTTFIYPYIYTMVNILNVPYVSWFYPMVTIRNFLLYGFVVAMLITFSRDKGVEKVSYHPAVHYEEETEYRE